MRVIKYDWLDDRQDARSLRRDTEIMLGEAEPESRFQGLVRIAEEEEA